MKRKTVAEARAIWEAAFPDSTFTPDPIDAPDTYNVFHVADAWSPDPCADSDRAIIVHAGPGTPGTPGIRTGGTLEITGNATPPTSGRWYFGGHNAAVQPTPDAAWDDTSEGGAVKQLQTAPDDSVADSGDATPLGNVLALIGAVQMDADLAALIAAGGATVSMRYRVRARSGIGISEASQDLISQLGIRVTEGATTTIRGTALELNSLVSSSGSAKWPAQSTHASRAFPAAGATNVLSAVAGASAGDYLIVEAGYRNFTDPSEATGGGWLGTNNTSVGDLPDAEGTTTALNSWIEICG